MTLSEFPMQTSFWFDPFIETTAPLAGIQHVDVAVVGGGFAGLSSARHLKESAPQVSVALLESNHIGYGASGRNGGLLMSLPPLTWLLRDFNHPARVEEIRWTMQQCQQAIQQVGNYVQAHAPDVAWCPDKEVLVARTPLEVATLRWLAGRFQKIGIPYEFHEKKAAQQFIGYPALLALTYEFVTIQPYQLARALRQFALQLGVELYENSPIQKMDVSSKGITLTTKNGAQMIAQKVILATNAYTHAVQWQDKPMASSAFHTYLLATEPLPEEILNRISQRRSTFAEPALSFFYSRVYQNRLLFGGIDRRSQNTPADDAHLPSYRKLANEMFKRFPFLRDFRIESAWGGAVQQTASDTPIVRQSGEHPNLILNLGYGGGSGVGLTQMSGRLTTELVLRHHDSDAQRLHDLYQASRFPVMGLPRAAVGVLKALLFGS